MARASARLNAVRFYAALQAQDTIAACGSLFRNAIATLEFDTFACGEVDIADRDLNVFYIIDWPAEWWNFYRSSGFIERDPLLDYMESHPKPFLWSELKNDRGFTKIGREALKLLAEHGWTEGLAVPVARGSTRYGLVSIAGHAKVISSHQRALLCLISEQLLTRIRAFGSRREFAAPPVGLTKREIDCLQLVALGYSDFEIAKALGISASTAHQHVEGGRKRLKAKSRAQMAARSVSLGIVSDT
jgi:LuxR family quorum sensing-dependent transcriptional regulator